MVQRLQHMLLEVEDPQVLFQAECKSSHMYLSLLEANMVIPKTTDDTTTNLNVRQQTRMAFLTSTGSHLSNSPKRLCIMVVPLNRVATPELGHINLNSTEPTNLLIAMRVLQHNRFKEWCLVSH